MDKENFSDTHEAAPEKKESVIGDTIKFVFISLLIVLPIRFFIAQPFIVSGASMDPTFTDGQYLIVDEISYRFSEPKRGDVIIFKYPKDPSKYYIKRIIGLPEETITVQGSEIYIRNSEHKDGIKISEPYIYPGNKQGGELTVTLKQNEYFVLGDNRKASSDSRIWGPLPEENIVGKPLFRLYPLTKISILPGVYHEEE